MEQRLQARIRHWDAYQFKARATQSQGSRAKGGFTAGHARDFADEMAGRLERRNHELDRELQLSNRPPHIAGGAVVVPQRLLDRLAGPPRTTPTVRARDVAQVSYRRY